MLPLVRIVSTGSEITQGLYADTNAQRLSRLLLERGFKVIGHAAAPDDPALIRKAIADAMPGIDLIVMTGGLGPTEDDVNRDVIAELLGLELVRDTRAEEMLRKRFATRNIPMPERNVVQAMLPAGCVPLYNHWGTAPGFFIAAGGTHPALLALPGPSSEWKPMIEAALQDELAGQFPGRPIRATHTMHVAMIAESVVNQALRDLFTWDRRVELGLLAHRGNIRIRLIATESTAEAARALINQLRALILERIPAELIHTEGPETATPAAAALDMLRRQGRRLAIAESCTGGGIAQAITDVPGCSDVFAAGWVTYCNEAKTRDLGVPAALIDTHGAVSEEVALAMACGARQRAGADVALSVTGIAGPAGGTPEKPVGTVWFGCASAERAIARRYQFSGDRDAIREWSVNQGLELLRRFIAGVDPARGL